MKDQFMKNLIVDNDMLVYLHDIISLKEKNKHYNQIDVFKKLQENNIKTIYSDLKFTRYVFFSFCLIIFILNLFPIETYFKYSPLFIQLIISIVYGILFVHCKEDIKDLFYQFKLKKAAQFAIKHYTYEEYVIFLDKYLSEISTYEYKKNLFNKINRGSEKS